MSPTGGAWLRLEPPANCCNPSGVNTVTIHCAVVLSTPKDVMSITVEATWENGVLKTSQPLPLREQAKVQVTVHIEVSRARQTAGLMEWTGSAEVADQFARDPDLEFPPPPEAP